MIVTVFASFLQGVDHICYFSFSTIVKYGVLEREQPNLSKVVHIDL